MNHLKRVLIAWCGTLIGVSAFAFTDEDLSLLDAELQQKSYYDLQKGNRIDSIRQSALSSFDQCVLLFEEYKSYNYDTAFVYANQLVDEARRSGNTQTVQEAMLRQAFLFLSSGLFHESLDVLKGIDPQNLTEEGRIYYYTNYARLWYDMADYVHGNLSYEYTLNGNAMSEQALALIPMEDTVRYWSTSGLYTMKKRDFPRAISQFTMALESSQISEHERAIAYSSIGCMYQLMGDLEHAEHYWVLAAVSDLRSSTKEAIAMAIVAELLYNRSDNDRAANMIHSAMNDALFYNARHRQLSIARILPIIENKQMQDLQQKNTRIERLSIALYVLLGLLLITLIILANRIHAIHRAHGTIKRINAGLVEANRIKEEYIGISCCTLSDLLARMEKYERYVRRKALEKRTDELQVIPSYIDAHECRKDFYKQFDEAFLRIFPHFIEQFNALLRDGEHIEIKQGEILSTELRIFALIRLGIVDNEQISKVLDYSINTVYTYKTRVRNRSNLGNEEFQKAVMAIPSFQG
ncbi:MAG: DUF6377 domain-containing protein [Paludibacteraceae bacterium]|nr:DUF6377 domain-containing protein [Paludibacteraceae bacterium]